MLSQEDIYSEDKETGKIEETDKITSTKTPKEKVLGFSLYLRKDTWYAGKRIGNKLRWVYIGKDKSLAEAKINSWCAKKGILVEEINKPIFSDINERLDYIESKLVNIGKQEEILNSLTQMQEKNNELLEVIYNLVKDNHELKNKLQMYIEKEDEKNDDENE